jgi:2,4-dienoyl-CoA reductase-like NADH-dependent reductase (Old Yellow Enzyme family)
MGLTFGKPHAATKDEIERIADNFAHAAEYLEKAGFDGIELHAAHGYLISQFLSRTTNLRTDEYGVQSVENRLRFLSDIVRAVKSRVSSNFIVAAKLNSVEFQDGGVTADEAREVVESLERMGLDFVELSGGTYEELGLKWERNSSKIREGFFIKFAKAISEALGEGRKIKMYIAGGMRSAGAMVDALNVVDGVSLSRPAAWEPRLASDILEGRVTGSLKPVEGLAEDLSIGLAGAGAQIWQIARGKEPLQLNDPATLAHLQQDVGAWMQKTMADADKMEFSKPVEYTGPEIAYGAVSAEA